MPAKVSLRTDFTAADLRELAAKSSDANQSRRLLSLAAVHNGMRRGDAARIGGMDRQTLRDWVHRFNAEGPDGLIDRKPPGPKRHLSTEQLDELEKIVEAGPDFEKDGVVRWRVLSQILAIVELIVVVGHSYPARAANCLNAH